jgi:hypothetical protein
MGCFIARGELEERKWNEGMMLCHLRRARRRVEFIVRENVLFPMLCINLFWRAKKFSDISPKPSADHVEFR